MIIESEYRGMAYTTKEQEDEFGYAVIFKYYREKERLIDETEVYAVSIEAKTVYKNNEFEPETYKESKVISADRNIANQVIEIFRLNQVSPHGLSDLYEDFSLISLEKNTKMLD